MDNTAAKSKIAELGKTDKSLELFNELERGVDDFSAQMIELINKNRQKIKELWLKVIFFCVPWGISPPFQHFHTDPVLATSVQETIIERKRQAEKVFETVDKITTELQSHIDQNTDGMNRIVTFLTSNLFSRDNTWKAWKVHYWDGRHPRTH